MEMSEAEIRCSYKYAKRPKQQIRILAQLNACNREQIEMILFGKTERKMHIKGAGDVVVDVAKLAEEYNAGLSIKQLSVKHEIPVAMVTRLLQDANVTIRGRGRRTENA